MKDRKSYQKEYRDKRREVLREYNRLWMKAKRDKLAKTEFPKLKDFVNKGFTSNKTKKKIARFKDVYKKDDNGRYILDTQSHKKVFGKKFNGYTKMKKTDVKSYFSKIRPKGGKVGDYCERCGILIGYRYINKKAIYWKVWSLCKSCYEHKKKGLSENTPDLEDLERFNIQTI